MQQQKTTEQLIVKKLSDELAEMGITATSTTDEVLEAGRQLTERKRAKPLIKARSLYTEGARFRVIQEGARFEGMVQFGSSWSGWTRNLKVGEIVTCLGWRPGWAEAGEFKQPNFTGEKVPDNASYVTIWPKAGLFFPWPFDGFLEPVEV